MKQCWIDYQKAPYKSPMTFWVHRAVDGSEFWATATVFDPPLQPVVPGKGYVVFHVEFDGFTFVFSSLAEIRECINTLKIKLLPRTSDLSTKRGTTKGPNSHWLSRLPAKVKSWKYKENAVVYLGEALKEFENSIKC